MHFRRSELLFAAYFLYAMAVASLRPIAVDTRLLILTLNPALLVWFCLFAWADRSRGFVLLDHVRDWFPIPLLLLAFREMGWMALAHRSTAFEDYWIGWDRALLDQWGLRGAIESLGPLLPNVLELSYLLVYVMPLVTVGLFYICDRRERLDDAYSLLLIATLGAYALYPFFPSEPPRAVFPTTDLPVMGALRRFNLAILGEYGIHMSVFPSGHAAAAYSSAFAVRGLLPEHPWAGRGYLLLATLIAVATVYGRYHFAVDSVAGLLMAVLALGLSRGWRSSGLPRGR